MHAARQPERVGQRLIILGIVPETAAATGRAEMRRMDRDNGFQAALFIIDEVNFFVRVKIGQAPGRSHGC